MHLDMLVFFGPPISRPTTTPPHGRQTTVARCVLVLTFKFIGIECLAEAGVLENLLPARQFLKDLVCKHSLRVHHFPAFVTSTVSP